MVQFQEDPVLLFWNTIMVNVTPSENALQGFKGAEGLFTGFLA